MTAVVTCGRGAGFIDRTWRRAVAAGGEKSMVMP
jgi:hypothetical protein